MRGSMVSDGEGELNAENYQRKCSVNGEHCLVRTIGLAQLLPLEESFLLLFRFDNPLESSVEFMKIWREYDSDGSGFIEADELKDTPNSFRAASPLVRLVEWQEGWESPNHPKGVLPQIGGGTESNFTVTS
ncbi:calbindin-32 [Trichonephila clavipes]|nr:calbindin-32 [Trichonephila clavipes]